MLPHDMREHTEKCAVLVEYQYVKLLSSAMPVLLLHGESGASQKRITSSGALRGPD